MVKGQGYLDEGGEEGLQDKRADPKCMFRKQNSSCFHEHMFIVVESHITRVGQEGYETGGDVRGVIKTGGMMGLDRLVQQHPQDKA